MGAIIEVHLKSLKLKRILKLSFDVANLPSAIKEAEKFNVTLTMKSENGELKNVELSSNIEKIGAGNIYCVLDQDGERALEEYLFVGGS